MNRTALAALAVISVVAAIVGFASLFTVHQTQQAMVVLFGNPQRVVTEPGLHLKWPFVETVSYLDARVLDYAPPAEEIIAADQKRVVVDTFARYRIVDALQFFQANQGSEAVARDRLRNFLLSSMRRVIGNRTLASLLSEERSEITRQIREEANQQARSLGIDIVDVRIRRADLPQANAEAIYKRMESEREREAREFRAQGAELAQRIRSRADREKTVLLAEAQRQAQILRGEGDSEATRIYAEAFNRDPEFFAFYRSMEAYRNALGAGTTLVLTPDSEFFRFFNTSPTPGTGAGTGTGAAATSGAAPASGATAVPGTAPGTTGPAGGSGVQQ